MKKHTLIATVVSVAILAIAMLGIAGCASNDSSAQPSPQDRQGSASTQETEAESTHIRILTTELSEKALSEVEQAYVANGHDGVDFQNSTYQGSRDLSSQTSQGIDADAVMSASNSEMDTLQSASLIDASTRAATVQDPIAIVAADSSAINSFSLSDAASGSYRLVIGNESDEIGNDVRQSLTTVDGYVQSDGSRGVNATGRGGSYSEALAREGQVTIAATTTEITNALSNGTADVGFLRESDVYRLGGVKIVGHLPANTHSNVVFSTAVVANSEQADAARDFLRWASQDPAALSIWQKWGFSSVS